MSSPRVARFKRLMEQHTAAVAAEWAELATQFNTRFQPVPELKVGAMAGDLWGVSIIYYNPLLPVEQLRAAVRNAFEGLARLRSPEGKAEHDARMRELLAWGAGGPAPAWLEAGTPEGAHA